MMFSRSNDSQRRDWQTPHFRKTRHYRGDLRGIVNRDVAALLLPSVEVDQPACFSNWPVTAKRR
ncbi:MAG: hypothetical protein WBE96_10050, partial [Pseudolabrys sp.]